MKQLYRDLLVGIDDLKKRSSSNPTVMDNIATLLFYCGAYLESCSYDQQLQKAFREAPTSPMKIQSAYRFCRSSVSAGLFDEAYRMSQELLTTEGLAPEHRSRFRAVMAEAEMRMGRLDAALRSCEDATSLAKDPESLGEINYVRGWALSLSGRPYDGLACFAASARLLETVGAPYRAVRARLGASVVQKNVGELGSAAGSLRLALRAIRKLGFPILGATAHQQFLHIDLRAGRVVRALRHSETALHIFRLVANRPGEADTRVAMARAFRLLGKLREAKTEIEQAHALCDSGRFLRTKALCWEEEGELAFRSGDRTRAARCFGRGLAIAKKIAPKGDLFPELARRLADVRIEEGRLEEARTLATEALSVSRSCMDRREEGTCYRTLGRLARREGREREARDLYDRAVGTFRLIRDRIELARTLEERAEGSSLPEKEFLEAGALYARAGMKEDEERVRRKLEEPFFERPAAPRLAEEDPFSCIVTESRDLLDQIAIAREIASSALPVLISGETGTGKELLARAIHRTGRPGKPCAMIDCAALSEALLESELFGHLRGAFTGAAHDKLGLLEKADGGTLFLDEIDKASPGLQAKLLRFLDTGEVRRLGDTKERIVFTRTIAAATKDLCALVEQGAFLPDLLFRLRGVELHVLPLRDRPCDIVRLAEHFLSEETGARGRRIRFSHGCLLAMVRYDWPGNVRELKMEVARLAHLVRGRVIPATLLRRSIREGASVSRERSLRERSRRKEKELLSSVLREFRDDVQRSAKYLEVSRATLYRKMKLHGLR